MRLVRIPGNIYLDIDHVGMITLKNADHDQVAVKIFLKDRTGLEEFYADRNEMLKFIEEYSAYPDIRPAPAYEGRPE